MEGVGGSNCLQDGAKKEGLSWGERREECSDMVASRGSAVHVLQLFNLRQGSDHLFDQSGKMDEMKLLLFLTIYDFLTVSSITRKRITCTFKLVFIRHCSWKPSADLCVFEKWKYLENWEWHFILSCVDISIFITPRLLYSVTCLNTTITFPCRWNLQTRRQSTLPLPACPLKEPFLVS